MRYLLLLSLVACEPLFAPAPPPVLLPPPPPPTTYIQNAYTYNIVTPVVAAEPEPEPDPEPEPAPEPAPQPPSVRPADPAPITRAYSPPPYCSCMASATLPAERLQLASTTVASCDEYLAIAELGVRCATSQPGPIERVTASLDLARRSWRGATATAAGRASLVDSCAVALAGMKSSNAEACGR